MTLTTHSIIAAAVTKSVSHLHPAFMFIVAIATHYLADSIPHWDYKITSIENIEDKDLRYFGKNRMAILRDIRNFTLDGFFGLAIVVAMVRPETTQQWFWVIASVVGGCLPDFLQGLYVFKLKFLRLPQQFHDFCHTGIRLGSYARIGIPFQLIIALAAIYTLA